LRLDRLAGESLSKLVDLLGINDMNPLELGPAERGRRGRPRQKKAAGFEPIATASQRFEIVAGRIITRRGTATPRKTSLKLRKILR
jgi:hypothetical protein